MKIKTASGAMALAAFLFLNAPDTSGPYTDSQGQTWDQLPKLSDYPDAATFDALFAHELFTTVDGNQFQIDRPWTPQELAYNEFLAGMTDLSGGNSGGGLRATVNCNHPADEEYIASFPNIPAVRAFAIGVVNIADASMNAQWGINLVPRKGCLWDSNDSADIVQLLDEAYRECGGLAGQDLMMAFSNDPTPGGAIGVGYIGLPRNLVKKYSTQTTQGAIAEHETGHNYTLQHCCDGNCIMQAVLDLGALGNFHSYQENCSGQNHSAVMNAQRNRY
ncbi:MAG TPA: M12 family metallo-peptidase [Planctomycetota bacterium]